MEGLLTYLSKLISKVHYPCTRKLITYRQIKQAHNYVKSGDIILTHVRGELSNVFLSHWSHAGIYSDGLVHEFVTKGKESNELTYFLAHKDDFLILRPRFHMDLQKLKNYIASTEGKGYDYKFKHDDEFQYCFEFVANAIMASSFVKINPTRVLWRDQYLAESFMGIKFQQIRIMK